MCGILGVVSKNNLLTKLVDSVKFLEYRGYDSIGIGILATNNLLKDRSYSSAGSMINNSKIYCAKSVGGLEDLVKKIDVQQLNKEIDIIKFQKKSEEEFQKKIVGNDFSFVGICHTRWATHGNPTEKNAHPQFYNGVAVVHNGIINNFHSLKEDFFDNRVNFYSDTDTELFVHAINYLFGLGFSTLEAISFILSKFEGNFAVVMIIENEPNKIFAFKKGEAPIIIGKGDEENVLASDVNVISSLSTEFYSLKSMEIAVLSDSNIDIYSCKEIVTSNSPSLNDINKGLTKIYPKFYLHSMDSIEISKKGYDTFMMKEINEQPFLVKKIIQDLYIDDYFMNLHNFDHITIVGCGSAYYAGCVIKSIIEDILQINVFVEISSEFRYKKLIRKKSCKYLTIFISQSGETFDTIVAHNRAKELGDYTCAIVNTSMSTLSNIANKVFFINAGLEVSVASTKAVVCQIITMMFICIAELQNSTESQKYESMLGDLDISIKSIINISSHIEKIAIKLKDHDNCLFLSRGLLCYPACEAALKMKELSYIHAEAISVGELKHGSFALLDENMPAIIFYSDILENHESILSTIEEIISRDSTVVLITDSDHFDSFYSNMNQDLRAKFSILKIHKSNLLTFQINFIVFGQILAYFCAKHKGKNVDRPRNLAKSVTVE
jgi:glutamine---fructose-6-phosphate transaminase (isomerizing)